MKRKFILGHLIDRNSFTSFVELGVWKGETCKYLLEAFPNLQYTGVDLYSVQEDGQTEKYLRGENGHDWDHEAYKADVQSFIDKYPSAQLIVDTTVNAAEQFEDKSIDMVFIDADHSYEAVLADIDAWFPKIRSGGIISGHDYSEAFPGVVKAVDERIVGVVRYDNTVWAKRVA